MRSLKNYLVLYWGLLLLSCAPKDKVPPNIILIMADDLGYETIQANGGSSYQTPSIDRLASEGMRFEHCYAQPLCTPSRVQIMTGIYNVRNYVRFGILDTGQTTFGHLFKEAGYRTCIVGKWQLGKDPKSPEWAGFDDHCLWQVTEGRIDSTGRDTRFSKPVLQTNGQLKTYSANDFGPAVVSSFGMDFMERSVSDGKPFLLYYPMILTHCPFSPTPLSSEWSTDDTTVMKYKGQAHYFEDMMSYTDHIIEDLMSKLAQLEISENTLIIFTGDNGTDVPIVSQLNGRAVAGAKGQSTDAGTRVPLIVKWPNKVAPGQINSDLIDLSDILPTICQAAGIEIPADPKLDGRSFLPQLTGKPGDPREWIYSWYSRNGEEEKARIFARTKEYKLYSTGEFYQVPKDWEEQLPLEKDLADPMVEEIHQMLSKVIVDYSDRRFENISPRGVME